MPVKGGAPPGTEDGACKGARAFTPAQPYTMRRQELLDTLRVITAGALLGLAFLPVAWSAKPAPATAAAAAPSDPNEPCFMCHADKDAKGAAGKSIAVDNAKWAKSVHGAAGLECTACHADVSARQLPHAEKLKPVDCAACHDKAVKEYQGTVHGLARKDGKAAAATCVDCHGTHDIQKVSSPESRTNHEKVEATCAGCHGNEARVQRDKLPGGNVAGKFHDSIHGKMLAGSRAPAAPTCTNCHGAHDIRAKSDEKSRTSRANIPDTCGSCHSQQKTQVSRGMHGKQRQEGNMAAPGCTDCHSAHEIKPHGGNAFQVQVIKECGNCHSDKLETYRDTFHGQVTQLGYARVATCAACHGAHDVRPASDPESMVSSVNRLKTCQKCHEGAHDNFAAYDPHANKADKDRNPIYYWAGFFMKWLLIGVFSFFGLHTVLWLYRSLRTRFGAGSGHQ